ncbi:hypothetical protein [Reichenbachiella versicolor]|uniref:hypothetical protein n=1 Tax=Reichenbachiella versicolor TaxID=1821036 RepID=UPI000D6E8E3F|nr:hypothetical protein [Reichenbachiella versicolor]
MRIIKSVLVLIALTLGFIACTEDEPSKSNLNTIESFEIDFGDADPVNYEFGDDISVSVPFGTDVTGKTVTVTVSENATVEPASGSVIDFVDGESIEFKVTAENGEIKSYNVTVTIRGEVGSGSKLDTYTVEDPFRGNSTTTYKYSDESGFVIETNKSTVLFGEETKTKTTFVYDDKNQVVEEKTESGDDLGSTIYTYNTVGQIISSEYTLNDELTYTYVYTYDAIGLLLKSERTDLTDDNFKSSDEFTIESGNVVKEINSNQESVATYDDKRNPFKPLYPSAYADINIGIQSVNENNPISGTLSDDDIVYEYNEDGYPISANYTYFDGLATVSKTYTYFE